MGFCVMATNPLPASPLSGGGVTYQELHSSHASVMFHLACASRVADCVVLLYKRADERSKSCIYGSKDSRIYAINFDQIINKQK